MNGFVLATFANFPLKITSCMVSLQLGSINQTFDNDLIAPHTIDEECFTVGWLNITLIN